MEAVYHILRRMCCTGGVALREAPLCIPAQHFIEHRKVLQSFKKGVVHTLCCIPSFWRSSNTLLSYKCVSRVQGREGQGWRMLQYSQHHWFMLPFFVESSAHSFNQRIICYHSNS